MRRFIADRVLEISASRGGDFDALLAVLDPDVVLRADRALVNGAAGLVWAPGGQPRVVIGFTIMRAKIVAINLVADPDHLRQLDLVILDAT